MSEEQPERPTGIPVITPQEAAAEAGKPALFADPVAELREHCKRFIEGANLTSHARSMAIPKLDEMVFWIRTGYGRG